jgi:hypothetical protein
MTPKDTLIYRVLLPILLIVAVFKLHQADPGTYGATNAYITAALLGLAAVGGLIRFIQEILS